jgi:hypothetical protein
LLATAGCVACASPVEEGPEEPPPSYVRFHGPWVPEVLDRDVVACTDEARESLKRAAAANRRELRDRTTKCMEERGWRPR